MSASPETAVAAVAADLYLRQTFDSVVTTHFAQIETEAGSESVAQNLAFVVHFGRREAFEVVVAAASDYSVDRIVDSAGSAGSAAQRCCFWAVVGFGRAFDSELVVHVDFAQTYDFAEAAAEVAADFDRK